MMIRLVLLILAVFLSWVLFVSDYDKRKKIIVSVVTLVISILGLWFEQSRQAPKDDLIAIHQINDCGVSGEYSYRTNYNIEFCLANESDRATATRISINFSALNCLAGDCQEIQSVNKEVRLKLEPQQSINLKENLDFDQITDSRGNIIWTTEIIAVEAIL